MIDKMYQKHYGKCVACGRIFIESDFSKSLCPYDRSRLENIGKEYPKGYRVPVGGRY